MNKELLKHIDILKTVPEIKESIEELKLGCWIRYIYNTPGKFDRIVKIVDIKPMLIDFYTIDDLSGDNCKSYEIIGQIHEGHLRMFLENYTYDGNFISSCTYECFNGNDFIKENYKFENIKIDNSKTYMEQSEDFYRKLNEFLIKEFNINLK